jgi:kynurenine formamidase
MKRLVFGATLLAAAACVPAREGESGAALLARAFGSATWVDLTHAFDSTTLYWPTARPFRLEREFAGRTPAGFYYEANTFSAAEHGGTHLDAPVHFAEGRHASDAVPLSRLIGPAVVVDVRDSAAANPDYRVRVEDLAAWERMHGPIPGGAIVLLRTGWSARWPDRERYFGTAATGEGAVARLRFPGLDSGAARWLVGERRIAAVGLDTPSIDHGPSTSFDSHRILMAENVPAFENVAALERLPPTGAWVVALPMKIGGGSGGPLRIVAALPPGGAR